ncbi:Integrase recombinase xerD-like [Paramuricea clavata]|uniref:Integrase recombinase xerD-like n=1 Tax=Paramuricea clavata TaxID=317549 RepID=A0A7D9DHZ9_PARCT|nr:Integrase recombinase xerD-like [Paramuricea clavata]
MTRMRLAAHPISYLVGVKPEWGTGTISVTIKRIEKVDKALQNLVSHPKTSARKLSSAVGMIISIVPVMGSLTRIMTHHCQKLIACSPSWDSLFDLDRYCILELEFWQSNLKTVNCRSFTPKPAATKTFFSDASQLAIASATHSGDGKLIAHRMFAELERAESPTFRELAAIKFTLEAFEPALQHSKVKWFTDSQAAAKIIQVGSMTFNLHQMAFAVFSICLKARIELDIQWIPRSLNEKANYLSNMID